MSSIKDNTLYFNSEDEIHCEISIEYRNQLILVCYPVDIPSINVIIFDEISYDTQLYTPDLDDFFKLFLAHIPSHVDRVNKNINIQIDLIDKELFEKDIS